MSAIEQDTPDALLPLTITNQAALWMGIEGGLGGVGTSDWY
jgi:hypothetical protein